MKRHAQQVAKDQNLARTLQERHISRIDAPIYTAYNITPGGFAFTVGIADAQGRTHGYAGRIEDWEVDALGIGAADSHRELLPECERKEQELEKRRNQFCRHLSEVIAASLFDQMMKTDPQFGYTRAQWEEMSK